MATSSLIDQLVSQNLSEPTTVFGSAYSQLLNGTTNNPQYSDTYQSIKHFWTNDIAGNLFASIQQGISNFFYSLFSAWLPGLIAYLSSIVKSFILNPNLAQIANSSNNSHDLSFLIRELANIIYGIAIDLLLLLFILSIWRYWTQASWRGNDNAMSAIGRLIFTIGIILTWPTIYNYEIELSNEMINAIFSNATDQLRLFELMMSSIFIIGIPAKAALSSTLALPVANPAMWAIGTAMIDIASYIVLLAICILGVVLIYELIYIITLKAIQTALLATHYVFAPLFLVFFATPSTENVATNYIRSFVEVSLWSFIWIGLLKVLFILIYSSFNPWGKILTAIGILQIMMQVPRFLSQAKISNISTFINPHFFTQPLHTKALEYRSEILRSSLALKTGIMSAFKNNDSNLSTKVDVLNPKNFSFGHNTHNKFPLRLPVNKLPQIGYGNNNNDKQPEIHPPGKNPNIDSERNLDTSSPLIPPVRSANISYRDSSPAQTIKNAEGYNHFNLPLHLLAMQSFARQAAFTSAKFAHSDQVQAKFTHSNHISPNPISQNSISTNSNFINSASSNSSVSDSTSASSAMHFMHTLAPPNRNSQISSEQKPNHKNTREQTNNRNGQNNKVPKQKSSPIETPKSSNIPQNAQKSAISISNQTSSPLSLNTENKGPQFHLFNNKQSYLPALPPSPFSPIISLNTWFSPQNSPGHKFNYLPARLPDYRGIKPSRGTGSKNDTTGNNLIFSHGNIPTLMGIPPIYPEPNKT